MKARLQRGAVAGLLAVRVGTAVAGDERVNAFDDPFFQIAGAIAGCPLPAGPFVTDAEKRIEAHHRAERGTTCWLAGQCSKPNSYAYDAGIAQALKARLAQHNPFADATLWVTVQGRTVYIEGCVPGPEAAAAAAIEAYVGALPDVQRAVALVTRDRSAPPPYKLRSAP